MTFEPEYTPDDRRGRSQRALASMLSAGAAGMDIFERWLLGEGLYLDRDEEAYEAILRGLPVGRDRPTVCKLVAHRVAAILERQPASLPQHSSGTPSHLFNLLMLAAELACPDVLAGPLFDVYRRGEIEGRWQGFDPNDALLSALAANQVDARLRDLWFTLLDQTRDLQIPGTPYDGFRGVLRMPRDNDSRGKPSMDDLGRALTSMAVYIDSLHHEQRDSRFRRIIEEIGEVYAHPPDLNWNLVLAAHENDLPGWAVDLLPTLYWRPSTEESSTIPLSNAAEELPSYFQRFRAAFLRLSDRIQSVAQPTPTFRRIVPRALIRRVPDDLYLPLKPMCQGHVVEIKTNMPEIARYLDYVAPKADEYRLGSPYRSPISIDAVTESALLSSAPEVRRKFPRIAPKIEAQRLKVSRQPA